MQSELVDTTVRYCDVSDVERFVRAYEFNDTDPTDPSKTQVQALIDAASERIDRYINTAFRSRQLQGYEVEVEMSHLQQSPDTAYRGRRRMAFTHDDPWMLCHLPHKDLQSVDKVEVITEYGIEDVTAQEGSEYRVDYRRGTIRPHVDLVTRGGVSSPGEVADRPRLRVSYTFGRTSIPDDIVDACARLVVADIVSTDTYGEVLPASSEDLSPAEVADRMESRAYDTLDDHKYDGAIL